METFTRFNIKCMLSNNREKILKNSPKQIAAMIATIMIIIKRPRFTLEKSTPNNILPKVIQRITVTILSKIKNNPF